MKKIFGLIFLAFSLFVTAQAAEGDYIIRYRSGAPVFFSETSGISLGAGMYLVPEEKALALKDAGLLDICSKDSVMNYYDSTPDDAHYSSQWNLPVINASYAWSLNTFGNDVLVGVIDSGLDPDHPDIDYNRIEEGYNFGALPNDEDYATNRLDTTDASGHGTAVSGAIAAKRNNSAGIAGIADKVNLLPLKVENKLGTIYTSSVVNAINAGAGYGCDILNLSLGQGSSSPELEAAIKNALNLGCIVIAAAGNDTESDPGDHIRYPAGYDGVISVGSTTQNDSWAESSVTNESVYISAPADRIVLLGYTGNYVLASGTSFAAPQVAAAAAIAKSINPDLTPAQFAEILKYTARRPGDKTTDAPIRDIEIGYGILDIEAMIKYMLGESDLYISPFDTDSCSLTAFNLGTSKIVTTSIFATYKNGKMLSWVPSELSLESGESKELIFSCDSDVLRYYTWNSVTSASPYNNSQYRREKLFQ